MVRASGSQRVLGQATALLVSAGAVMYVSLTAIGILRFWHPLPHWDMWDGYVEFWTRLSDGDWSAWWSLHNEHRIVLARVIFWLDFTIFNASGQLLIVASATAAIAIAGALVAALRWRLFDATGTVTPGYVLVTLAALIVCMETSWLQQENFLWGFQIQFFFAVLLPLLAFLSIGLLKARSVRGHVDPAAVILIPWALVVLSAGSIASGLMTAWLVPLLAVWLRLRRSWVLLLAATAPVLTWLYLLGYQTPSNASSPLLSLREQPMEVAEFVLAFLGSPWSTATGLPALGIITGVVFIVTSLGYVLHQMRAPISLSGRTIVMIPILVLLWACITATGRIRYGIDYALISRYTTPVLAGWSCLLILAAPRFGAWVIRGKAWLLALPIALVLLLAPTQAQALSDNRAWIDSRNTASLALALGVPDPLATYVHVWDPNYAVGLTERLRADEKTLFGSDPLRSLKDAIKSPAKVSPTIPCTITRMAVDGIANSDWQRITGVVQSTVELGGDFSILRLTATDGRIAGYAVLQHTPLSDYPQTGPGAWNFVGYLAPGELPDGIHLSDDHWACSQPMAAP